MDTTSPTPNATTPGRRTDFGRLLARVALAVWMPAVALGVGSLMVGHWAPLPTPTTERGGALATGLEDLLHAEESHEAAWTVVHVLYADCGCSRRVADYLTSAERSAGSDTVEHLILVGDAKDEGLAQDAEARGLSVTFETQTTLLDRFGIESAPLFIVVSPAGELSFVGGYTVRKQGLAYEDLSVLAQLKAGATPAPIPVLGCGVSTSLQSALDPLSLKYR